MTDEKRRPSDNASEPEAREQTATPRDDDSRDDEIPLDISGHEDRERPDDASSMLGSGESEDASEADDSHSADEAEPRMSYGPEPPEEDDVKPVEVLVQLAKDGEIEPWDIDIVRVTDKFLERLDEADLRTSGRALFYASVLLRMKGDAMLNDDGAEEDPWEEPWEEGAIEDGEFAPDGPDPFAALEAEIDRRIERKRARGMPQTLDELVRDLREAERDSWWKESREYDTSDSPSGFSRGTQQLDYRRGDDLRADDEPTEQEVTGTAHGEDIEAIIDDVYGRLREQYDAGREEVLFAEIERAAGSRVQTFLGLLFLSHRGRVRLQQDDLFGDLWIRDPAAVSGSGEAVAD